MATVMASANGPAADVKVSWVEWGADAVANPVTGARTGSSVKGEGTYRALVYSVPAVSGVRVHGEIETGDVILDFLGDVPLLGKDGLVFDVVVDAASGRVERYVPKNVSDKLASSWDVCAGGKRLLQPVLVRKG